MIDVKKTDVQSTTNSVMIGSGSAMAAAPAVILKINPKAMQIISMYLIFFIPNE